MQFSSGYRAEQFIPCRSVVTEKMGSSAVLTKSSNRLSVYRVIKVNKGFSVYLVIKVSKGLSVDRVNKVIKEVSFYRVTLYLPSLQWLPSSKEHCVASMDHASTPTKCMTMLSNVVDVE